MADTIIEIHVECVFCGGTGIFRKRITNNTGKCCHHCDGSGMALIRYTPFIGRKTLENVMVVKIDNGNGNIATIPYSKFLGKENDNSGTVG